MKRYETYKDSGIQWVGEIPSHWEIVKLRYTGTFENGLTYSTGDIVEDDGILVLRSSNIQNEHITFDDCVYVNSVPKELMVSKGDIIICSRNGSAALIGKCAIIEDDVKASFGAFMMRYRANINNKFAFYLFLSAVANYRGLFSTSTINQLTMSIINQMQVALPSDTEQKNIAAYLDRKVSQIDATIAEKEQMLEDIKAYRSAIISEAVTKGLDKNVEMKDSGIEWIGIIPKTWKIVRIKHILDYKTDSLRVGPFGSSLSGNDFKTEGYWVYNQRVVLDNNFNSNDTFVSQEKYKELSSFKVFAGDILLTTRGTIGKVAIVPNTFHEGVLHPCLIRFRVDDSIVNKDFLTYYFNDTNLILDQVKYNSNSTTIDVIYSYTLKELIVSLPPLDVQNDIVAHLNYRVQKIDEMLKEASQSVENLKSYKSTLITEAVTGKIDLREWKPKEENV